MYQAMTSLGYAADFRYHGPIKLSGDPKGASVLILGRGLAGMVAAFELRKAGYKVQVLEYNNRAGGRNWSLHGGDTYTELGGVTQQCEFDEGLYFNPGPWRIPYHHRALLDYCKRLNVALEPFVQVNYNAYVHSTRRLRRQAPALPRSAWPITTAISPNCWPRRRARTSSMTPSTQDDKEGLLQALRALGRARPELRIQDERSPRATCAAMTSIPGGGVDAARRTPSTPLALQRAAQLASVWHLSRFRLQAMISRPRCSSRSAAWA